MAQAEHRVGLTIFMKDTIGWVQIKKHMTKRRAFHSVQHGAGCAAAIATICWFNLWRVLCWPFHTVFSVGEPPVLVTEKSPFSVCWARSLTFEECWASQMRTRKCGSCGRFWNQWRNPSSMSRWASEMGCSWRGCSWQGLRTAWESLIPPRFDLRDEATFTAKGLPGTARKGDLGVQDGV